MQKQNEKSPVESRILQTQLGRVVSVYPRLVFRMESVIIERLGSGGSVLMLQEGEAYMRGIIEQLNVRHEPATKEEFLEKLSDELRETGWGDYKFSRDSQNHDLVVLEGTDLPFEHEPKPTYLWFLMGMLGAIVESAFGAKIHLNKSEWIDGNRVRVELELNGKAYFGPLPQRPHKHE